MNNELNLRDVTDTTDEGRGFERLEFEDGYNMLCKIAQSSVWADYEDSAERPGTSAILFGSTKVGADGVMHLTREHVRGLIERMQHWLDTGSLIPGHAVEPVPAKETQDEQPVDVQKQFMVALRRFFHLWCGFDIGLCPNPSDFCFSLRSVGGEISRMNNYSQGEKWRLNPEPDWANPMNIHEQIGRKSQECGS